MTQRLLIIRPGDPDALTVSLAPGSYRLGRDGRADINIAGRSVSGFHCTLLLDERRTRLLDLDSTNGTFVNGKRVRKTVLSDNDTLKLGDVTLRYREEAGEEPGRKTSTIFHLERDEENGFSTLLDRLDCSCPPDPDTVAAIRGKLELYRRNGRLLETLYSLLEQVLPITERDEAIALLLRELSELLGLEIASLYLGGEKRFAILEKGTVEWSDDYPVVSRSVLGSVMESGKPVMIEAVEDGDEAMKTLLRFKIRQALCFPVLNREGSVLGAVYCVSRKSGELRILGDDSHFLSSCSSLIALILENFRMREREVGEAYAKAKQHEERRFAPLIHRLRQERENLSLKLGSPQAEGEFFGIDDSDCRDLRQFVERAAPTGLPILITGETGVGKSLFARAIHSVCGVDRPFVVIDCTTIPHELLESELFGHEKGAFTGAHARKPGKVSMADGGTLFIDEIGELDGALQAKLLRFIQTGNYEPVGSTKALHSGARLIAATNRDLRSEVASRRFREDLYYRLNVLTIELPPLRLRPGMVMRFADHFLSKFSARLNPGVQGFTPAASKLLTAHRWPGNIRELENTVMRGLVNACGKLIDAEECAIDPGADLCAGEPSEDTESTDLKAARERIDRILISRVLDQTGRNVSRSAELLKISRNSLMDLMKKYGF